MKRQIISMVLAGALVLSVSTVASAADTSITSATEGVYKSEVTATGETKVPTISVTLSDTTSKKIGLNPYALEYSGIDSSASKDKIVNKEETITNGSDVPIAVSATTLAELGTSSEIKFATAALKGNETTKSVFAYLELMSGTSYAEKYDSKSANQLVFGTKATTKKAMVTLDDKNGANKAVKYKVKGDVASAPAKAWADTDVANFKITFQFDPVVPATA